MDAVDRLCERVGVTAERLIPELWRYRVVMGWMWLCISIIVCAVCFLAMWKTLKKADSNWLEWGTGETVVIIGGFWFGVIFGVIMVFNICDLIGMYVAPESSTICYILKELR